MQDQKSVEKAACVLAGSRRQRVGQGGGNGCEVGLGGGSCRHDRGGGLALRPLSERQARVGVRRRGVREVTARHDGLHMLERRRRLRARGRVHAARLDACASVAVLDGLLGRRDCRRRGLAWHCTANAARPPVPRDADVELALAGGDCVRAATRDSTTCAQPPVAASLPIPRMCSNQMSGKQFVADFRRLRLLC